MKTCELTGAALDYAVAKCEDYNPIIRPYKYEPGATIYQHEGMLQSGIPFDPSRKWALGGPIIERTGIGLEYYPDGGHHQGGEWCALTNEGTAESFGPTPLVAAMRCYVASKLGDEIDIPVELLR